jgi:hypothetical protein
MTATRLLRSGAALLAIAAALMPGAAQAYWRGGVYFAFPPVVVGPPAYYYPPPPVYVAPPPVYAPPPAYMSGPPPQAQACYAGPWVCPLDQPMASGNSCYCTANGGRTWGQAR